MKRVRLITASRADAGIYIPVISALEKAVALKASHALDDLETDCVIVLGDTMPMLNAAIVAAQANIPMLHIHGGDQTGSIDNKIRDAITAFADWHFPSLPVHADRLKQMGVPENRIRVVGPLGIYAMKDAEFVPELKIRKDYHLGGKPIILIIQHPVSNEWGEAGRQMIETLEAVKEFEEYQPVIIWPNSEPGSSAIICAIAASHMSNFGSLSYLDFVSLLKYSTVIVGNSSCGLVEAPLFGVPCVNVGTRQGPRIGGLRWDTDYDREQISFAIRRALEAKREYRPYNPYQLDIDGPEIIVRTIREEL